MLPGFYSRRGSQSQPCAVCLFAIQSHRFVVESADSIKRTLFLGGFAPCFISTQLYETNFVYTRKNTKENFALVHKLVKNSAIIFIKHFAVSRIFVIIASKIKNNVMKQQILESLKAKYEGVSDAILGRIAEKLAKTATTAEDVETAVAGVTFQQVLESYGDSRATEAQQSAVSNYEKKHNLKDGKPIEKQEPKPQPQPQNGGEPVPAWAQALIDSNKAMSDEIQRLKTERTTDTRKQQLSKVVEKLPDSIRKVYDRIPVDQMSDDDFNAMLTDVNGEVESISQSIATPARGNRPFVAAANSGDKLTKAQEDAIAHREGAPTPDGQPF